MSKRASPRTSGSIVPFPESMLREVVPTHSLEGNRNNAVRAAEQATANSVWTAEWNGCIRVRRLPLGQDIAVLERKDKSTFVTSLLLVERRMWAALSDGTIRIYDPQRAELLFEFKQHDGAVNCLTQVAGRVYSGGSDWKVFQWRIAPNRVPEYERLFYGHTNSVRALCGYTTPSGDRTLIFSGGDDALIKAWDPHAPKQNERDVACVHTFQGHTKSVLSLERVPGRHQLWSGGEDWSINVWDIRKFAPMAKLEAHKAPVTSLQFVETRMWSAGKDGLVFVWDVTELAPLREVGREGMRASDGYILNVKRLFRTYVWKVWTFTANGTIQCWDANVPGEDYEVEYDEHERTNKALIDGLRESLMEQSAECNAQKDKVRELEATIDALRAEDVAEHMEEIRKQLILVTEERDELLRARGILESKCSMADELLVATRQQLKRAEVQALRDEREISNLTAELKHSTSTVREAHAAEATESAPESEVKQELERIASALQASKLSNMRLEEEAATFRRQHEESLQAIEQLQMRLNDTIDQPTNVVSTCSTGTATDEAPSLPYEGSVPADELRQQCSKRDQTIDYLHAERDALQEELAVSMSTTSQLRRELAEVKASVQRKEFEVTDIDAELNATRDEAAQLRKSRMQMVEELREVHAHLRSLSEAHEALQAEMNAAAKRHDEEIGTVKSLLADAEERAHGQSAADYEHAARLEAHVAASSNESQLLQRELDFMVDENRRLSELLEQQQLQLHSDVVDAMLQTSLSKEESSVGDALLQEQIEHLQETHESLYVEISSLRSQLEQSGVTIGELEVALAAATHQQRTDLASVDDLNEKGDEELESSFVTPRESPHVDAQQQETVAVDRGRGELVTAEAEVVCEAAAVAAVEPDRMAVVAEQRLARLEAELKRIEEQKRSSDDTLAAERAMVEELRALVAHQGATAASSQVIQESSDDAAELLAANARLKRELATASERAAAAEASALKLEASQVDRNSSQAELVRLLADAQSRCDAQFERAAALEKQAKELQGQLAGKEAAEAEKDRVSTECTSRNEALAQEITALSSTLRARDNALEENMQVLQERLERVRSLEKACATLEGEVSALVLKNEDLEHQLAAGQDVASTANEMKQKIVAKEQTIADLHQLVEERNKSISMLNERLATAVADLGVLRAEETSTKRELEESAQVRSALQDELRATKVDRDALLKKVSMTDERNNREQTYLKAEEELREALDARDVKVATLSAEFERQQCLLVEMESLRLERGTAREECANLRDQLASLQLANDELHRQAEEGREHAVTSAQLRSEKTTLDGSLMEMKRAHAAELAALQEALTDTQASNRQLLEDNTTLAQEQLVLMTKLTVTEQLQEELRALQQSEQAASIEARRNEREAALLRDECEVLRKQLAAAGPLAQSEYAATIRELELHIDRRCQELEACQKQLADVGEQLDEDHAALAQLLEEANGEASKSNARTTLEARASVFESKCTVAETKLASAEREISVLRSRLRVLEAGSTPGMDAVRLEVTEQAQAERADAGTALSTYVTSSSTAIGFRSYTSHLATLVDVLLREVRDEIHERVISQELLQKALQKIKLWRQRALATSAGSTAPADFDDWETPQVVELKHTIQLQRRYLIKLRSSEYRHEVNGVKDRNSERSDGLVDSALPSQRPSTTRDARDSNEATEQQLVPPPDAAGSVGRKMMSLVMGGNSSLQLRHIAGAQAEQLDVVIRENTKLEALLRHKEHAIAALLQERLNRTHTGASASPEALASTRRECATLAAKNAQLELMVASLRESTSAAAVALETSGDARQLQLEEMLARLFVEVDIAREDGDSRRLVAETAAQQVIELRSALLTAQESERGATQQAEELRLVTAQMEGKLGAACDAIDRQQVLIDELEESKRLLEAEVEIFRTEQRLLQQWVADEGYKSLPNLHTSEEASEDRVVCRQLRDLHERWQRSEARLGEEEERIAALEAAASLAASDAQEMRATINHLNEEAGALQRSSTALEEAVRERDAKVSTLESRLNDEVEEATAMRHKCEELQGKWRGAQACVARLEEQVEEQAACIELQRSTMDSQTRKSVDDERSIATLTAERVNQEMVIEDLRRRASVMRETYEKREAALRCIESELEQLQQACARLERERDEHRHAASAAASQLHAAQSDLTEAQSDARQMREQLEEQVRRVKAELQESKENLANASGERRRLGDRLDDAHSEVRSLTTRLALTEEKCDQLHRQIATLEERLATDREQAFEEEGETVLQLRSACVKLGIALTGAETRPLELATQVLQFAGTSALFSMQLDESLESLRLSISTLIAVAAATPDYDEDDDKSEEDEDGEGAPVADPSKIKGTGEAGTTWGPTSRLELAGVQLRELTAALQKRARQSVVMQTRLRDDLRHKEKKYIELLARNKELHDITSLCEEAAAPRTSAAVEVRKWLLIVKGVATSLRPRLMQMNDLVRGIKSDPVYREMVSVVNGIIRDHERLESTVKSWEQQHHSATVYGEPGFSH